MVSECERIFSLNSPSTISSAVLTVETVFIAPNSIDSEDTALCRKIARGLAEILDVDEETVYNKTQKSNYYELIKRRVESDIADLKTAKFKVQIAFSDDYDRSRFDGIEVLHYEKHGTVCNMIVQGDRIETEEKLKALGPLLLDVLPLSLEEVFTYEAEALGYTFSTEDKEETK